MTDDSPPSESSTPRTDRSDDLPSAIRRALDRHGAFEPSEEDPDAFAATTTAFDATVTATPAEGERDGAVTVGVTVPTITEAVDGEVAPIVEDGWYETFELRVAEAFDATSREEGDVSVERTPRHVHVECTFRAWEASRGVADAKALIDFVEGTYVQGIIPGYDYRDPVAGLLQRARQTGETADGDAASDADDDRDPGGSARGPGSNTPL